MKKSFWDRVTFRLGWYERRFLNDPLTSVPEFKDRITWELRSKYGNDVICHQAIAENLLFAVQYVAGGAVEGDIAEFGCMSGRTANVIAAAMGTFRTDKKLHLFDSFEGLPQATSPVDLSSTHVKDGTWHTGTCKGITPEELRKRCLAYIRDEQIQIYKGWYSQTMSKVPAGTKFGMLHVDCDLYQSTMDCLVPVFSQKMVTPGAMFLFDDWYCNHSSNEHGERKAWRELTERYKIEAEDAGAYSWGCKKLIVHDYKPG